jgi:hypothetical protein
VVVLHLKVNITCISSLYHFSYILNKFYCAHNKLFIHTLGQVQFLDRHHLLIKFGSVDGVVRLSSISGISVYNDINPLPFPTWFQIIRG